MAMAGRKKQNGCRAVEHLENSVQLYENMYRRQQELHRLPGTSVSSSLNECGASAHTEATSYAVNDEGGRKKSGTITAPLVC